MSANTFTCLTETRVVSGRPSHRLFGGILGLLFAGSVALTVGWCESMSAMSGMPMPGGWTMSMMWMRMPGQTWASAAASFLGMWAVMMAAMMLPSLAPTLWRYRGAVTKADERRLDWLTALVILGYFVVWSGIGLVVFAMGDLLAALAMESAMVSRAVPLVAGVVVITAGGLQFSRWKARHLRCCRESPGRALAADAGTAWRHGLELAWHCSSDCGGWMAILLVMGMMDVRAMAMVTAAITAERLAPAGERLARVLGAVVIIAGLSMLARMIGVG